jgi:glucokinase
MSEPIVAGIDLGGTNMQIALVDQEDQIIARGHCRTQPEDGVESVMARIAELVHSACQEAGFAPDDLAAVGIAAPGAIDMPSGVVLEAPNLRWRNVPLRDALAATFGCEVVVDNDVNGAVWGEYRLGAGRGFHDLIGVWVGTGVGGGLVINGHLHHGTFHSAGEIGQTIIDPHGERGRRTVEDLCSRTGMARAIERELKHHPQSLFISDHDSERAPSLREVADQLIRAWKADDPLAVNAIRNAAHLLGIALANWVTVLAPGRVVIGGGVTEALGQLFIDRIRESFERDVFPARCRECELVMTELAGDAGTLGAAMLARDGVAV